MNMEGEVRRRQDAVTTFNNPLIVLGHFWSN